ncbi:major capsid protein [Pseudomonas sp.]|uniref:major capsid protein n=1 Tax=Pseudomonas sp. TaxID=306 RepID=UPI003981BCA3
MLKAIKRTTAAVAAISVGAVTNVYAEVPTGVSTAITAAGADAAVVGGLVLVVLVGIMAFKWIRKAM